MVKTLVEWPFSVLLVAMCAVCAVLLFGTGWLLQRFLSERVSLPTLERELFALIGAAFGIVLAFVIFVQWTDNDRMKSIVDTETGAMAAVLRYSESFDTAGEMDEAVLAYRDLVVNVSVPALKDGRVEDAWNIGGAGLTLLIRTFDQIEPTEANQTFYELAAGHIDTLTTTHRERIEVSQSDLSPPMWWFVILFSVLMLVLVALIQPPDSLGAILLLGSVVAFFGLTLTLIVSLNYPLNGTFTASIEPYFRGVLGNSG